MRSIQPTSDTLSVIGKGTRWSSTSSDSTSRRGSITMVTRTRINCTSSNASRARTNARYITKRSWTIPAPTRSRLRFAGTFRGIRPGNSRSTSVRRTTSICSGSPTIWDSQYSAGNSNSRFLVSHDAKVSLYAAFGPRATEHARVRTDVFQLAVDHIAHGFSRCVFSVRFEMNHPGVRVERCLLQWDGVRARVNRAGNGLPVPEKFEDNVRPLVLAGPPVAAPRAFQWVTKLRGRGQRPRRNEQQRREPKTQ